MKAKKESSLLYLEHNPDESDAFKVAEVTYYVLRRGIFNIAFLKKVERSDLLKSNKQINEKT